jgi:hypothetical protein
VVTVDQTGNLGTSSYDANLPSNLQTGLVQLGQQLESVGALAAALTAIPNTLPPGVNSGCGIGSGVYGSAWAGSFGCVARLNHSITFNAGGSFASVTSSSYSNPPGFMGRFGFFFQF